jgi:hypothetical protein
MRISGISKTHVSRLCAEMDDPADPGWPYLWIDATYAKVCKNGRIVSVAVIVAVGVNSDGRREMLGRTAARRTVTFWTAFLRNLARVNGRGRQVLNAIWPTMFSISAFTLSEPLDPVTPAGPATRGRFPASHCRLLIASV